MTGVMIAFAFVMSLGINFIERMILHHDDALAEKTSEEKKHII